MRICKQPTLALSAINNCLNWFEDIKLNECVAAANSERERHSSTNIQNPAHINGTHTSSEAVQCALCSQLLSSNSCRSKSNCIKIKKIKTLNVMPSSDSISSHAFYLCLYLFNIACVWVFITTFIVLVMWWPITWMFIALHALCNCRMVIMFAVDLVHIQHELMRSWLKLDFRDDNNVSESVPQLNIHDRVPCRAPNIC